MEEHQRPFTRCSNVENYDGTSTWTEIADVNAARYDSIWFWNINSSFMLLVDLVH